jgi:hypothetical protein
MDIRNNENEVLGLYLVYNPSGGQPFKVHSKEMAIEESHRLSKIHPNQKFYILQIVGQTIGEVQVKTEHFIDKEKSVSFTCKDCRFNENSYCVMYDNAIEQDKLVCIERQSVKTRI